MARNKAQNLTEYAICLSLVLIALITMNIYLKRGLQGRYLDVTDYATREAGAQEQYEPYYAASEYDTTMGRDIIGTTVGVGSFRKDLSAAQTDGTDNYKGNYMIGSGETEKETEETIKNALP